MRDAIDTESIREMVHHFYGRVREDPILGPIFEGRLAGRWPEHLDKMVDFWRAALLHERGYAGNPRAAHATLEGVGPRHFQRWLELFSQTLDTVFAPSTAALIHTKARAMARGLLAARGFSGHHLTLTEAEPA